MDETDQMELAPRAAQWYVGLGVSECCHVVVEVLTTPCDPAYGLTAGTPIISRCGFCHAGFFAADTERAAS